jgi:hypothetical protein
MRGTQKCNSIGVTGDLANVDVGTISRNCNSLDKSALAVRDELRTYILNNQASEAMTDEDDLSIRL